MLGHFQTHSLKQHSSAQHLLDFSTLGFCICRTSLQQLEGVCFPELHTFKFGLPDEQHALDCSVPVPPTKCVWVEVPSAVADLVPVFPAVDVLMVYSAKSARLADINGFLLDCSWTGYFPSLRGVANRIEVGSSRWRLFKFPTGCYVTCSHET